MPKPEEELKEEEKDRGAILPNFQCSQGLIEFGHPSYDPDEVLSPMAISKNAFFEKITQKMMANIVRNIS